MYSFQIFQTFVWLDIGQSCPILIIDSSEINKKTSNNPVKKTTAWLEDQMTHAFSVDDFQLLLAP